MQKSYIVKRKSYGGLDHMLVVCLVASVCQMPQQLRIPEEDAISYGDMSRMFAQSEILSAVFSMERGHNFTFNKLNIIGVGGRTRSTIFKLLVSLHGPPCPLFPTLRLPFMESNLRSHSDKHCVIGGRD